MKGIDFAKIGRKLMHENPQAGVKWQCELDECKAQSMTDLNLINSLFISFCDIQHINITDIRYNESRSTNKTISQRRLFIAVIMQMYDPLNINGFTGRKMDRVREKISDVLNCNQVWISQVWASIHNDILHLRGYKEETQDIIQQLKATNQAETAYPIFLNTKRIAQATLFD